MRLIIHGTREDVEVIAESFAIVGSDDQFAVHPSIEMISGLENACSWTATHVPTNMAIARENSISEVINVARATWHSKTPGQIESAKALARERLAAMLAAGEAS